MHSMLCFAFGIIFIHKNKCSYIYQNNKLDEISDNIEMFMKPIKKISGIFPNHEFEILLELEHKNYKKPSRRINYQHPSNTLVESIDLLSVTPATTTTENSDSQIVYMKDLKKALEDFEKKHANEDCTKKTIALAQPTESVNLLPNFNDNPPLSDVLQLIKRGAKLQYDMPKLGDPDLNWVKIKVPTA